MKKKPNKLKEQIADLQQQLKTSVSKMVEDDGALHEAQQQVRTVSRERDRLLEEVKNAYLLINNIQLALAQFKTSYEGLKTRWLR
jgi:chromosome segregation ATPase